MEGLYNWTTGVGQAEKGIVIGCGDSSRPRKQETPNNTLSMMWTVSMVGFHRAGPGKFPQQDCSYKSSRLPHLVAPRCNYHLGVEDVVITGGELVGVIHSPLEHGTLNPSLRPSVLTCHDSRPVAPLEPVAVAHAKDTGLWLHRLATDRCQPNLRDIAHDP